MGLQNLGAPLPQRAEVYYYNGLLHPQRLQPWGWARKPEPEQGQRIKITSKNNQAAAGLCWDSDVWACRLRCSSSRVWAFTSATAPQEQSYQVTHSGTQQWEEVWRFLHSQPNGEPRLSKGQDLFSCYKLPKTSFPKRKTHRKVMSFNHIQ